MNGFIFSVVYEGRDPNDKIYRLSDAYDQMWCRRSAGLYFRFTRLRWERAQTQRSYTLFYNDAVLYDNKNPVL